MVPSRSHPLATSPTARLANRALAAIWRVGLTPKPPLDPDYLWRIGSRGFSPDDETAGRSPEDVADFRERLERLGRALREEAELNALGHTMAYGQLTGAIRKRHALGLHWRRNPAARETQLAPPIIVLGQMRSGTTRIHRLLASDPAHAATRFCDSVDPVPRRPDVRPLKAAAGLAIARRINPWLDTLHPFGSTRADEELGWLSAALSPCAYEAQWRIPSYIQWSEARSPAPVYREFARILRTDAAARGNAGRARVLKCPQFTEDVAAIADAFPSARFVLARRDPAAVFESSVSLVASQSAFQARRAELEPIRAEWRRKLSLREARVADWLKDSDRPCAIVEFDALDADWRGAVRGIYRALGLTLTPQALEAMEREQRGAARSPHHGHAAALDTFERARG